MLRETSRLAAEAVKGMKMESRKPDELVFRDDLYPRIETSAVTVQKYAEDLSVLPPVEINQHNEIIDGWHRWTAHKKAGAEEILVAVTETGSEAQFLELAVERNSAHGLQLSQEDKRDMARRIYASTPEREREAKKSHLAKILSVSERTIRDWLSRIDKDAKEARNKRIFDLWLACWTQEEIADEVGCDPTDKTLRVSGNLADLPDNQKAAAEHATDFEPPIYNVWKQQTKTPGSAHPGNSEVRWLDNLLFLYTKPFDVVVDPFAGGGSTIDICRKRFRRYFVSDRAPVVEREKEIRKHDLVQVGEDKKLAVEVLKPPQWKDVRLVYLDPPYWAQAAGKYSDAQTDLGNMSLVDFTTSLASIINAYAKKVRGYIALIIQPTQWNAPEHRYTDHTAEMIRWIDYPIDMRVSVPYESQQCNAQMVDWAKENRQCLVLTREIVVWKIE